MDFQMKLQRRLVESVVVSTLTRVSYLRAIDRLQAGTPRVGGKRTHYHLRSALIWFHCEHIHRISRAAGWPDCTDLAELEHLLSPHLDALDVLRPLGSVISRGADIAYFGIKSVSNGKRRGLGSLPNDWREQLLSHVDPRDQLSIILLAVTGCRPSELVMGIDIRREGRRIHLGIRGGKVTEQHGQPYRVLTIDKAHPWGRRLAECLPDRSTQSRYQESVRSLQHRIRRFAVQWQRGAGINGYQVSAYSFRHQLAADLKRHGESAEWIAAVLGHRSTRTATCYGAWQQGKSGQGGLIQGVAVLHAPRQWPSNFTSSLLTNHCIVIIPKGFTAESLPVSPSYLNTVSNQSRSRHTLGGALA